VTQLPHHHFGHHVHIQILGLPISDLSRHVLREIAGEARLQVVHITSVRRTIEDQARIFYKKHVEERKVANYKNENVGKIVAHARALHAQGQSEVVVKTYLIDAIEHVRGGPVSISRHLGASPFYEVFDVSHYSGPTKGASRHDYMTGNQAHAFLEASRRRMPYPVARLGHSSELGFQMRGEFLDEKCFHFEVLQPVYDKLEQNSGTMIA